MPVVAEWPKYVVHATGFYPPLLYIRRDSETSAVFVRDGSDDVTSIWSSSHDATVKSGIWKYVTEAEAKALLIPEPAKKMTKVRLWVGSGAAIEDGTRYVVASQNQPTQNMIEIHSDGRGGFYIETDSSEVAQMAIENSEGTQ